MQQDEGFTFDQQVELIDYHYRPLAFHPRVVQCMQRVKCRAKEKVQEHSLLLNQSLREECVRPILMQSGRNVVYNNFSHQVDCQQDVVVFDSNFESGNLEIVVKRKYLDYELYMRPDTNTASYYQWFYFKTKVAKGRKTVNFTFRNFIKQSMLYSSGLKPYYRSSLAAKLNYQQIKGTVSYFQNPEDQFYNLHFSHYFEQDGEEVEFCSQPPYSFEHLLCTIKTLNCKTRWLGKSLLGRKIPYLVYNERKENKIIGLVIARQHPGESVGSWLMEGFIRRLESMRISLAVQWIIVPMINVDGVVLGNNRTGVLGQDFNRNWNIDELAKKEKILTENNALLSLIKNIRRAHPKKLKIFIDFHGHSSQPNVFSYGPPHELNSENYYTGKLLPELIAKHSPFFNLEQCSAVIKADKKNTARSLLFNSFAVPFSYTIECSFGIMNGKQVGIDEFLSIGSDIATASMEFISNYLLKEKSTENSLELLEQIKLKYQERKDLIEEFDSDSEEPTRERKLEQSNANTKSNVVVKCSSMSEWDNSAQNCSIKMATHNDLTIVKPNKLDVMGKLDIMDRTTSVVKEEQSLSYRYCKQADNENKKRMDTQVSLKNMTGKLSFLPKLKERARSKKVTKSMAIKEGIGLSTIEPVEIPLMMNIQEIQKRLFRLKNSRIGKKILIINAYGV